MYKNIGPTEKQNQNQRFIYFNNNKSAIVHNFFVTIAPETLQWLHQLCS